uniref:Uncharacterized protein n=1 Tax=Plectus sambesii TaxID=2011161 RepID=A0A914W5B5_9BILA
MEDIFQGYDQRIRPIKNKASPIIVQVQPLIVRLIEVNPQQEYIKLSLSISQTWKDEFLTWNPAEYDGTTSVMVPKTALWLPDTTVVTTSFEAEAITDLDMETLMVEYDGTISRSYPYILSNYCPMITDEFPFDKQDCIIKITSWNYAANVVRYEPMYNETDEPQNKNSAWDMLPIKVEAVDFNVENAGQYRQIWYTLTIKRKPAYYVWVLIMPTLIITALSIAGIFAPINNNGDRQEKLTLGLTTLLTLAVILSMVTGEMPRSSNLPVLGQFVLVEISIIVICMAVSVVILFLHQRATTRPWPVPPWLEALLACDCTKLVNRKDETIVVPLQYSPHPSQNILYGEGSIRDVQNKFKTAPSNENGNNIGGLMTPLDEMIAKVKNYIEKSEKEKKALDDEEKRKEHWMILFDHVDLLLFLGFQLVHIVLYFALYYRSY